MSTSVVYLLAFAFLLRTIQTEKESTLYSKFHQNDYKIKFEWFEIVSYNKHYFKEFRGCAFKYNRTCTAINVTVLYDVEIGNDLEVVTQSYKFLSNEYREFPMRVQLNFCAAMRNNLFGAHQVSKCGNFFGCPVKKGVRYEICNFVQDESHFPPLVPNGRYKVAYQGLYNNDEIFRVNTYAEVFRPIVNK